MKNILTIILASVTTLASAQSSSISKSIDDNAKTLTIKVTGSVNGKEIYVSSESAAPAFHRDPHAKTFQNLDEPDYRKHVRFNPETGDLFLQYHFKKNGEEYIFEKTVNANEKSESERQHIIDKFEREIELPGKSIDM